MNLGENYTNPFTVSVLGREKEETNDIYEILGSRCTHVTFPEKNDPLGRFHLVNPPFDHFDPALLDSDPGEF